MKTFEIRDIIPKRAGEETLTPRRRFFQIIFKPIAEEGFLNTEKIASRNFWDAFLDGTREDGAELNIDADPLFLSICEQCDITADNIDNITWDDTNKIFDRVLGKRVRASVEKDYVEPYHIPGSLSKIDTRYTYSTIVLEGEDRNSVFRGQNHVIIQDPERVKDIQKILQGLSSINEEAREERQRNRGVATANERTGTGAIRAERSLGGRDARLAGEGKTEEPLEENNNFKA